MERIPRDAVVLVDGWNLLVRLAGSPEALAEPGTREEARGRLLGLLEPWAEARNVRVVVAWDGPRAEVPPGGERVRSVGVDPPAEADDWIVHEATRLHREGTAVRVVTRDRGLLSRIPREAASLPMGDLVADLLALGGTPVHAPHVRGSLDPGEEIPASRAPVDPGRLPRRHPPATAPPDPPEPWAAPRTRPAPPAPSSPAPRDPGAEARRRAEKERRRARWERARRRRASMRRRKR